MKETSILGVYGEVGKVFIKRQNIMIPLAIYYSLLVAGLATMLADGLGWVAFLTYFVGMPGGAIALWYISSHRSVISVYGRRPNRVHDLIWGTLSAAGSVGAIFGLLIITGWASVPNIDMGVWWLVISITVQQIVVAVIEEFSFRGVIQSILSAHFGPARGLASAAVLFGVFHIPNILHQDVPWEHVPITLANLSLMGLVFGWAFQRTQHHLALPVALHFGWNAISFSLQDAMTLSFTGPDWLTGTVRWFPESGVLGTIGLVILGIALLGRGNQNA